MNKIEMENKPYWDRTLLESAATILVFILVTVGFLLCRMYFYEVYTDYFYEVYTGAFAERFQMEGNAELSKFFLEALYWILYVVVWLSVTNFIFTYQADKAELAYSKNSAKHLLDELLENEFVDREFIKREIEKVGMFSFKIYWDVKKELLLEMAKVEKEKRAAQELMELRAEYANVFNQKTDALTHESMNEIDN